MKNIWINYYCLSNVSNEWRRPHRGSPSSFVRPLFKRSSSTQLIKYRYNASLRKRELDLRRASPLRHICLHALLSEKRMTSITVRAEFIQADFKCNSSEMCYFRTGKGLFRNCPWVTKIEFLNHLRVLPAIRFTTRCSRRSYIFCKFDVPSLLSSHAHSSFLPGESITWLTCFTVTFSRS